MMWRSSVVVLVILSVLGTGPDAWGQSEDERRSARRTPVVEVFEQNRDAVVNITATSFRQTRDPFGIFNDDLFDRFFDLPIGPRRRQVQQMSVGSGFMLHKDGFIVTNAHVVARTGERKVVFADGREFPAEIIAIDPQHDLAILRIEAGEALPTLTLGRSDDLMQGETVIAIGNPFGFQHTVTTGVVSATNRTLDITDNLHFEGLIQTDASINPGNSGGPLLNVLGELIGVSNAIRTGAENIGFAIPVDQLRERLPSLLSIERRDRVTTGLFLEEDGGLRVARLEPGSAAEAAGIRAGDLVVAVDRKPTRSLLDFHIALLGFSPAESVDLMLKRDGANFATALELRQRPLPDGAALSRERLGAEIEEVAADTGRRGGDHAAGGHCRAKQSCRGVGDAPGRLARCDGWCGRPNVGTTGGAARGV